MKSTNKVFFFNRRKVFAHLKVLTWTEINQQYINFLVNKEHLIFQKDNSSMNVTKVCVFKNINGTMPVPIYQDNYFDKLFLNADSCLQAESTECTAIELKTRMPKSVSSEAL